MSVLVTGAAGFVGSHLVDRLLSRGEDVVGLDNFDDFYSREAKLRNVAAARDVDGFRMIEGDVRDTGVLPGLPHDIEAIVHLAARVGVRPSIRHPALYTDVNLMGTTRVLDFARYRGLRSFVFASSSSVYGGNEKMPFAEDDRVDHPISPYAATKKAGELLCHSATHLHGLATICLRFFTVYGPRQRPDMAVHKFARIMKEGGTVPMFGDGSTFRDYTFISNIVDGVEQALDWARTHEGSHEVVNLGGGSTVTLAEMIRILGQELGVEPRVDRMAVQPGDMSRTCADLTKARRLLGYEPGVGFREGVRAFVEWFG